MDTQQDIINRFLDFWNQKFGRPANMLANTKLLGADCILTTNDGYNMALKVKSHATLLTSSLSAFRDTISVRFFLLRAKGRGVRRDGNLKAGDAVYAVSACRPDTAATFREMFLQDASGSRRTARVSCLRGGWRRRMSTLI